MITFEIFLKSGRLPRLVGTKLSDGEIINSQLGALEPGGPIAYLLYMLA